MARSVDEDEAVMSITEFEKVLIFTGCVRPSLTNGSD